MEALQRLQKVRPRAALHHNGGLHRVLHQLAQVRVHRVEHLALLRELLADVLALSEDGFQVRPLLQQVGPHAHHRVRVRQPLLPHRQLRVKVACVPAGAHGLQLNDVVVQHFAHRLRRRRLQHGHSKARSRQGGEDIPRARPSCVREERIYLPVGHKRERRVPPAVDDVSDARRDGRLF
eukprot:1141536-Pyramimonas_sp.AAC.2